jgi:hypothetical protein
VGVVVFYFLFSIFYFFIFLFFGSKISQASLHDVGGTDHSALAHSPLACLAVEAESVAE